MAAKKISNWLRPDEKLLIDKPCETGQMDYRPTGRSGPSRSGLTGRIHPTAYARSLVLQSASPVAAPVPPSSLEKILDTAEALFARSGFEGVGLREVALRSGLSKSALFHYFSGKADLYSAVLGRILGAVLEGVRALSDEGSARARLKGLIETIVDSLAASPTRGPLLLRSIVEGSVLDDYETPDADEKLIELFEIAARILSEGAASGELRAVPVPHALQALVGLLVFHFASGGFGEEVIGGPIYSSAEIQRFKEFVVPFTLNGLTSESIHG